MRSYIEEIDYGGYSTEDDYVLADGSVGCSLPDLRYVFYAALGAVVWIAALALARLWKGTER